VRELLEQAAAGVKRTQTIANLRTACAALRPEGNFDKALGLVDIALADYPGDPELETLRRELDQERQAALAAAACREALQEAQWLLDQDRPHLAARFLREKSAGLPDQPELQARLQAIEQMIPAWENRRFVQDCLARAAALEQVEQWSVAMTLVEQALEASPGSVELQDAAERLRQRRREEESRKKLARRLEAIQQKIGAQSWTEALALIEAAQREFSDNAELAQRLEQAREGKRRADCDAIAAEARQYMTDGESDRAEQVLRRGMESLPGEAVLIGLWEELQSANRYRDECRRAQVLFGRRQLREAEEILAPLAAERRPEAQALLEAVRAARAASEEDDFYDQAREQALKLIMQRQFDQAADLIRNLLNLFPGDPVLERDLKTAEVGLTVEGPALEPAAAAKAEPVERVGAVPVEPVPEPPVQPQIVVAPRMESLKRTSFLPYLLWPAIGGSILLFLSTSGATIWKLSHHEAHAAAMPPKPEPIRRQPTPTPAPAIDPPAPPEEHIAAHAKVVVNPPSPRQAFTPPAFPSNADRTQAVALPPPVTERLPSRQEAPRLPAAGQIAPPAPAPKAAEKPVEKAPEPPPPPVVREPKPVSHPAPPTPQLALQRGISGEVRLEATVSPRGTIMDIKALSGDAILVAAAKAAVWKWRYEPGSINGRPIPSKVQIRILFEGRR
jgi:protein TonB